MSCSWCCSSASRRTSGEYPSPPRGWGAGGTGWPCGVLASRREHGPTPALRPPIPARLAESPHPRGPQDEGAALAQCPRPCQQQPGQVGSGSGAAGETERLLPSPHPAHGPCEGQQERVAPAVTSRSSPGAAPGPRREGARPGHLHGHCAGRGTGEAAGEGTPRPARRSPGAVPALRAAGGSRGAGAVRTGGGWRVPGPAAAPRACSPLLREPARRRRRGRLGVPGGVPRHLPAAAGAPHRRGRGAARVPGGLARDGAGQLRQREPRDAGSTRGVPAAPRGAARLHPLCVCVCVSPPDRLPPK